MLATEADYPPEPAEIQTARRAPRELPVELDRVLAAIRAGMDPDLAGLLTEAERETRARQHRTLDLVLNLDPVGDPPTLDVWLQLCGGGGPSCALTTTLTLAP